MSDIPDHIEIPHRGDCTPVSMTDAAWIFMQGGGADLLKRIAALESHNHQMGAHGWTGEPMMKCTWGTPVAADKPALPPNLDYAGEKVRWYIADLRTKLAEADTARMAWRDNSAELERAATEWLTQRNQLTERVAELERHNSDLKVAVQSYGAQRDETRAERDALKREVATLRQYGNKACTAMADEALAKGAEP